MEYIIKNDELTAALKTMSGTFASVKDSDGREYIHQPDDFWAGQAPVCFPVCGGLRNFKAVTKSGRQLSMKRHGIVKDHEFTMLENTGKSVKFELVSGDDLLAGYPYPFRLVTAYELDGRKIRVTYSVTNTGNETMPFMIGGHPAFACPLDEGEEYSDYQIDFEKDEDESTPTPVPDTGLIDQEHRIPSQVSDRTVALSHELFSKYEIIFDRLNSRQVTLHRKGDNNKGLRITFRDFPYLILWSSKNGGPFIAIEPWAGLSTCSDEDDVFEHKRNCMTLEPGMTRSFSFEIEILK